MSEVQLPWMLHSSWGNRHIPTWTLGAWAALWKCFPLLISQGAWAGEPQVSLFKLFELTQSDLNKTGLRAAQSADVSGPRLLLSRASSRDSGSRGGHYLEICFHSFTLGIARWLLPSFLCNTGPPGFQCSTLFTPEGHKTTCCWTPSRTPKKPSFFIPWLCSS